MKDSLMYMAIFALVITFSGNSLSAQSTYQSAIGLRLGSPATVTYKTFLDGSKNALEVFVAFRGSRNKYSSFGIGVGYQVHNPVPGARALRWYYGIGAAVYAFSYNDDFILGPDEDSSLSARLLGFLGLDYKFPDAPINVSLDWVPAFAFGGFGRGFGADRGALAVRYTLE